MKTKNPLPSIARALALAALIISVTSCQSQTVLGKHPADKVLPAFFTQNGNLATMQAALGTGGSITLPVASATEVFGKSLGHGIRFINGTTNGPANSTLLYSLDEFVDGGGNDVGTFMFGAQVYAPRWLGDGTGLTGVAPLYNPQFTGDVSITGGGLYGGSWEIDGAGVGTFPSLLCSQITATTLTTQSGILTNGGLVWYAVNTNANPSAVLAPNGSICTTTNGQFYVRSNAAWVLK